MEFIDADRVYFASSTWYAKWGQCSAATILSSASKLCCERSRSELPFDEVEDDSRALVRLPMGPVVTAFLLANDASANVRRCKHLFQAFACNGKLC
jgi:hypothetical protein